ncbi:hypothetical protein Tco_0273262 [Tanacetum coccineum]
MTTPVKKRNANKFYKFHGEVGHNTDECMHLRKQIEEMLKAGKLSRLVKEIKQNNEKEQPKSFSSNSEISFPPLGEDEGTEGPMIIEAEIGGHCVHRQIQLLVAIRDEEHSASALMNFVVVRSPSPYNGIFWKTGGREIASGSFNSSRNAEDPDMTGVPRHIAEHRLNVRKGCSPVRQKKRRQAADINQAIQEKVGKLVEAGIMREVHYHDWLSNPVMVKKHDNSWRMCAYFKDLNKACPKDGYPLPKIDWKVESLCGFPFKCFLDTYKDYHQIQMAKEDEEKTALFTSQWIFCYTKMPFGLRNTGATY